MDIKALIIDLSHSFGGASTRVLTLMRNMPQNLIALAALQDSPVALEARRYGIPVFIVGKRKTSPLILIRLVSLIKKEGFQVLDTQNPQSKFWGSIAALFTGVALVSTLNSWYGDEHGVRSLKGVLYSLVELGTNFALNRYIVVSKSIYKSLVQENVAENKIDLIYNAVNIDVDAVVSAKEIFVEKLNLPGNPKLVSAVGRLTWAKGYEDLIDAFCLMAEENPDVYGLIAGDGELRQELELRIEKCNLKDRVLLLGHLSRDDVLSLVKGSNIFVMPSRTEGTPIALLEAACLRKPILATRVGGIPELIVDDEEGVLIPDGDPQALALGIKKILANHEYAERLAEAAYRRVKRDFTVSVQVQSTRHVYVKAWMDKNLDENLKRTVIF